GHRAHAVAENADVEIVPGLPRLTLRREKQLKQDLIEHPGGALGQRLVAVHPGGLHRIGAVEQENHATRIPPGDTPLIHDMSSVAYRDYMERAWTVVGSRGRRAGASRHDPDRRPRRAGLPRPDMIAGFAPEIPAVPGSPVIEPERAAARALRDE